MWREIERESFCFPHTEGGYDNSYFESTVDGVPALYVHAQYVPGTDYIQLHLSALAMSMKIAKELRKDFSGLKKHLAAKGIRRIIGLKFADDPKLDKWRQIIRLFGFTSDHPVTVEGKEYRYIQQEI